MILMNWLRGLKNGASRHGRWKNKHHSRRYGLRGIHDIPDGVASAVQVLEDRTMLAGSLGPQDNDFTSVALFFNLKDNGAGMNNLSGYNDVTAADVNDWMHEGEAVTTSEFVHNYWSDLSYGQFRFDVDALRDGAGAPLIVENVVPPGAPGSKNAKDWEGITKEILKKQAGRIFAQSDSHRTDGPVHIIPSIVLVQNYDAGAQSKGTWDYQFTADDGNQYRVVELHHVQRNHGWETLIHEYSHDFLDGEDLYKAGLGKIGYWDILGDASAVGQMSNTISYYKERIGWIDFKYEIDSGPAQPAQEYRLSPYGTSGDAMKIVPDPLHSPDEYFLVEYRAPISGARSWTPDGRLHESGLLITHVSITTGMTLESRLPAPFMDIEEADGNDGKSWDDHAPGRTRATVDLPGFSVPSPSVGPIPGEAVDQIGEATYVANNWPTTSRPPGVLFPLDRSYEFTPQSTPSSNFYGERKSGLYITDIHREGDEAVFTVRLAGNYQSVYTLSSDDQVYAVDVDGDGADEAVIYNGSQLALADAVQNQFHVVTHVSPASGRLFTGDFNGDGRGDIVLHQGNQLELKLGNGIWFEQTWRGHERVGEWTLGSGDQVFVGDFSGDGRDDIFLRNGEWAGLLQSTGRGFTQVWIVSGRVGSWSLDGSDQHFVGDFTGDGRDDVFIRSSNWAGILRSEGTSFRNTWIENGAIGVWDLQSTDSHSVGDFDGDGRADVFVRGDDSAGLLISNGTSLDLTWFRNDRIGEWNLGVEDWHVVGDFNQDAIADIFIRSSGWGAILVGEGRNGMSVEWIGQGIDNWTFQSGDRETVGQFNLDGTADLFLYRPGQVVAAAFTLPPTANATLLKYSPRLVWKREDAISYKDVPPRPDHQLLGNFTGDGLTDVLVTNIGQLTNGRLALYGNVNGNLRRIWESGPAIDNFPLSAFDSHYVGDFNNDGLDDLFLRSPQFGAALFIATGSGFRLEWDESERVGNWQFGWHDDYSVGDFDGDGRDDIFAHNSDWAGVLISNGAGFTNPWIVNESIDTWRLSGLDRLFVGNIIPDSADEILLRRPQAAGVLKWNGFEFILEDFSSGAIGMMPLGDRDKHLLADFDGDGTDEIFIRNDRTGTSFSRRPGLLAWDGGALRDVVGSFFLLEDWLLEPLDQQIAGDFDHDGVDDLLIWKPQVNLESARLIVMRFNGTTFETVLSAGGGDITQSYQARLGAWPISPLDQMQTGRFYDPSRDEIFLSHPGGWTGVYRIEGSVVDSLYGSGTQAHYRELTADPNFNPTGRTTGPAAVLGTQFDDEIEISYVDSTTASVRITVTLLSGGTENINYLIDTGNGIHVEAGGGDDTITIDARIGRDIDVQGMADDDTLVIAGFGVLEGRLERAAPLDTRDIVRAGDSTISFTEIEQPVQISNITVFTVLTPAGDDTIRVSNENSIVQVEVGNPNGDLPVLQFRDVLLLHIDAATNDPLLGNDVIDVDFNDSLGIDTIFIEGGVGFDQFWVRSTKGARTILRAQGTLDEMHFGNVSTDAENALGSLSQLDGDIEIADSNAKIFMNDTRLLSPFDYELNHTSYRRAGMGEILLVGSSRPQSVELRTGSGGDTVRLHDGDGNWTIDTGDGDDRLEILPARFIDVAGRVIPAGGRLDRFNGNLNYYPGDGLNDALVLDDSFSFSQGTFTVTTTEVQFFSGEDSSRQKRWTIDPALEEIDIRAGIVRDLFQVQQVRGDLRANLRGNRGDDRFEIATGDIDTQIRGDVHLFGGDNQDTVLFNDRVDNVGNDEYRIRPDGFAKYTEDSATLLTEISYEQIEEIELDTTLERDNRTLVEGFTGDILIRTSGNDTIDVGDGSLEAIHGVVSVQPLNLTNSQHFTLNINDQDDTGFHVYDVNAGEIVKHQSSGDATIQFHPLLVDEPTLNANADGNRIDVHGNFTLNTTINAGGGNDTIRVTPDLGNPALLFGSVVFDGQDGEDTLEIFDGGQDANYTIENYTIDSETVAGNERWSRDIGEVEIVKLHATDGANTFNVTHTDAAVEYELYGRGDDDIFNVGGGNFNIGGGNFMRTIKGHVSVNGGGGSGTDHLNIEDSQDEAGLGTERDIETGQQFPVYSDDIYSIGANSFQKTTDRYRDTRTDPSEAWILLHPHFTEVSALLTFASVGDVTLNASGTTGVEFDNRISSRIEIDGVAPGVVLTVNGNEGVDTFQVNGVPEGMIRIFGGDPIFDEVAERGDRLFVEGTGGPAVDIEYGPTAADRSGGGISFLSRVDVITFTELEPVTISNFASLTFVSAGSRDELVVDSPQAGQRRISGTSDGVAFESLTFFDVPEVTLDLARNDGADPFDRVVFEPGELVARGLERFRIVTGEGEEEIIVGDEGVPVTVITDEGISHFLVVTNTNDSGPGSLRAAIENADAIIEEGSAIITFAIPASDLGYVDVDAHLAGGDADPDVFVISPEADFPALTRGHTVINGQSQQNATGDTNPFGPEIVIAGYLAGEEDDGLIIRSDANHIHGLNIQRFAGNGILVTGDDNTLTANYIGTSAVGGGTRAALPETVGWWPGEGTAEDLTGNHDGTVVNGTTFAPGIVGQAFSFDGVDDMLSTPLIVDYTGGATFELWVKTIDDAGALMAGGGGATRSRGMGLFIEPGGRPLFMGSGETPGVPNFFIFGPSINDDAFHHLAATWTGDATPDGVKFYLDGELIGTTTATAAIETDGTALYLGHHPEFYVPFAGLIDEPAIFGRALSSDEIQSIFNQGSAGKGTVNPANGGDGVQIVDSSGNLIGGTTDTARNVISGNNGDGVNVTGGSGNTIQGNYIGTTADGMAALGNGDSGVRIEESSGNLVGGDSSSARNVISGNPQGIGIVGFGSTGNVVSGNYIGVDQTGAERLFNRVDGIVVGSGASGNLIGGLTEGERNIISGNGRFGVFVGNTLGNEIQGNYIGTDSTGTQQIRNNGSGIAIINDKGTVIGGTQPGAGNVISGNSQGIRLYGGLAAKDVRIEGNLIGTTADGRAPLPNINGGILIVGGGGNRVFNATIGGTAPGAGNVISGNNAYGIRVVGEEALNIKIQGNKIGTDIDGLFAVPNGWNGIEILQGAGGVIIGGTEPGARNIISGNDGIGISIDGSASATKSQTFFSTQASQAGWTGFGNISNRDSFNGTNVFVPSLPGDEWKSGGTFARASSALGETADPISYYADPHLGGTLTLDDPIHADGELIVTAIDDFDGSVEIGFFNRADAEAHLNRNLLSLRVLEPSSRQGTDGIRIIAEIALANGTLVFGTPVNTPDGLEVGVPYTWNYDYDPTGGTGGQGRLDVEVFADGVSLGTSTVELSAAHRGIGASLDAFGLHNGGGTVKSNNPNTVTLYIDNVTYTRVAGNTIQGNYIGTTADGMAALGNATGINIVDAADNVLGAAGAGNVISANATNISITGASSTGNVIQGNKIGTDATGTVALTEGPRLQSNNVGVYIQDGSNNQIGGTGTGEGNLISGHWGAGIWLYTGATENLMQGNYIGTNADATAAIINPIAGANLGHGINIYSANNTVGADNVISGNYAGILLWGAEATGNLVKGNLIGTDVTGTTTIGNVDGIHITLGASGNLIGGTTDADRNVISGNGHGIFIGTASGNTIQGNYIGTTGDGLSALANSGEGIELLYADNNLIGGGAVGAGNVISANHHGVYIQGFSTGNRIQGNLIGTDKNGTGGLGNDFSGVVLDASANIVGTDGDGTNDANEGNIIADNKDYGISIWRNDSNVVAGNWVGVAADNTALGNVTGGIHIAAGSTFNRIGTDGDGVSDDVERNVISGNLNRGIFSSGTWGINSENVIAGNYIGTDVTGMTAMGNGGDGVAITGENFRIGTDASADAFNANERNVIANNGRAGIYLDNANGTVVAGNYVGVAADGVTALGNALDGVELWNSFNNTIGGTTVAERNVISANTRNGILIQRGSDNTIQGNSIGTTADGMTALGNGSGVSIVNSSNNSVEGNVIAHNAGNGATVVNAGSVGNTIRRNSIYSNGALGIDLGGDSVTPNDDGDQNVEPPIPPDTDTGPNELQNFPVLRSASVGGTPRVSGQLRSTQDSTFTIDFYASAELKQIGEFFVVEGERWVGSAVVTTNEFGVAGFSTTIAEVVRYELMTATATNSAGSTSEFSGPIFVGGGGRERVTRPPRPNSTNSSDTESFPLFVEGSSGEEASLFSTSGSNSRHVQQQPIPDARPSALVPLRNATENDEELDSESTESLEALDLDDSVDSIFTDFEELLSEELLTGS
jgi:M6 family metalloprotease-like protein